MKIHIPNKFASCCPRCKKLEFIPSKDIDSRGTASLRCIKCNEVFIVKVVATLSVIEYGKIQKD